MLKLESFFGLSIDYESNDFMPLLEVLKIKDMIESTKVVQTLSKQNGRKADIVSVAIRQQTLKSIKTLLNENMLDYEESYYAKEINTSSNHDRRYGAEEKLIEFALIVATTKSLRTITEDPAILSIKQIREAAFKGNRFDRLWDILSEETHRIVESFRKSKK
jgi:hypothetical protein